jgi:hypothetical protein
VSIQEHRLDAGEHIEGAVEVPPTRLNHPDIVIGEIMNRFLQKVRVRDEVGIENEQIVTLREPRPIFQSSCLVAGPIRPVDVLGIETAYFQLLDARPADFDGFVRRIIQKLDLHFIFRIIQGGDGPKQAVDHMHFIENRQLDGHKRQVFEQFLGFRMLPRVLQVEKHNRQTV